MVLAVAPTRSGRARRMAGPAAALAGVAATWAAVGVANPDGSGPTLCLWRAVTGLDCPFCGATRAAAALAHGDVILALDHNALLVLVVLPLAAVAWARWARRAWGAGPPWLVSDRAVGALMAVTLAWWALRLAVPWLGSTSG